MEAAFSVSCTTNGTPVEAGPSTTTGPSFSCTTIGVPMEAAFSVLCTRTGTSTGATAFPFSFSNDILIFSCSSPFGAKDNTFPSVDVLFPINEILIFSAFPSPGGCIEISFTPGTGFFLSMKEILIFSTPLFSKGWALCGTSTTQSGVCLISKTSTSSTGTTGSSLAFITTTGASVGSSEPV